MTNFVLVASIFVFLCLPYYLRVFLLDKKKLFSHVGFSIAINGMFCIAFMIIEKTIWTIPLIVTLGYSMYTLLTYLFYVKNLYDDPKYLKVKDIFSTPQFAVFAKSVLAGTTILLLVDMFLLLKNVGELAVNNVVYFMFLIIASYIQIALYFKDMQTSNI